MGNSRNILNNSKVASSFLWVIIEKFGYSGINLCSTLILARLLTPHEFGLVGSVTIIMSISNMIVESGMGAALVNKKNVTNEDYNTVFTFNFLMSAFLFTVIFFSAPFISEYFNKPILERVVQVLALTLIFNAFTLIQRVILLRKLLLKKQSFMSMFSLFVSAGGAIITAYMGGGVWSIVIQMVLYPAVFSLVVFLSVRYLPKFQFSRRSFNELLGFGGRVVLSSAIQVTYSDIISSVITKIYSVHTTGLYVQSQKLISFPLFMFRSLFDGATFPILSKAESKNEFKTLCSQMNRGIYLLSFPLLLAIPFNTEEIIRIVLGENWLEAVNIFRILSVGIIISLIDIAAFNTLKSAGEVKAYLNIGTSKAIVGLSLLMATITFPIEILLYSIIFTNMITGFIAFYYVDKLTFYTMKEQLRDIFVPLVMAVIANVTAFIVLKLIATEQIIIDLLLYFVIMLLVFVIQCVLFNVKELNFIIKKIGK